MTNQEAPRRAPSRLPTGPGDSVWVRLAPTGRWGTALLVFPAVSALVTLAVLAYAMGLFDPREAAATGTSGDGPELALFTVLVTAYNLLGPLALAALISVASRRAPRGMAVVTAACVVHTAATTWSLISMVRDESSTAALLLLFLPLYLGALLVPFIALTALVHWLRGRSERR